MRHSIVRLLVLFLTLGLFLRPVAPALRAQDAGGDGAAPAGDGGGGDGGGDGAAAPAAGDSGGDGTVAPATGSGNGDGGGDGATAPAVDGGGDGATPSADNNAAGDGAASSDTGGDGTMASGDGAPSASGDGGSTAAGDGSSTAAGDGSSTAAGDGSAGDSGDGSGTAGSGDGSSAATGDGSSAAGDATASPDPGGTPGASATDGPTSPGDQTLTATPSKPLQALTPDQAQALMEKMGEDQAKAGYSPDHIPDGCYWRAHMGEQTAESYGVDPSVVQRAQLTAPGYWDNSHGGGSLSTTDPKTGDPVNWSYHTAPVIPVQQPDGSVKPMVFDPAAGQPDPVSPETWAQSLTGQPLPAETTAQGDPAASNFDPSKAHLVIGPGSTSNPDQAGMFPGFKKPDEGNDPKTMIEEAYSQDYDPQSTWAQSHGGYTTSDRYVWHNKPAFPRLVAPTKAD